MKITDAQDKKKKTKHHISIAIFKNIDKIKDKKVA